MPRYTMFRGARFYGYGTNPVRKYRRVYSLRRSSRPASLRGFYPGSRSSFRRVTGYRYNPRLGVIRQTYTIPEKKFKDEELLSTPVDETPQFYLLNGLTQGASSITRIGQKICMRSNHLKYTLRSSNPTTSTGNTTGGFVRVMLVLDLQPNGTTPSAGDLFEDASPGLAIVSGIQKAYSQRWKVFYDKRHYIGNNFVVSASGVAQAWQPADYGEQYLKMNHYVEYSDTSIGDVTDISTGAFYLVTVAETAVLASQPIITSFNRIRYTDN